MKGDATSWATSPGRRRNMQANRSRDTAPELAVRRVLHGSGFRYRVDIRPVPSLNRRADIVFTRPRVAVFIDGCYWHGCPVHGRSTWQHNSAYWVTKIQGNVLRDSETNLALREAGWRVLRFWEHEDPVQVADRIAAEVRAIQ